MVARIKSADLAVLQHVSRYRLTTPRILTSASMPETIDEGAAEAILDELASNRWLAKLPLAPTGCLGDYYQLTEKAAAKLGCDPKTAQSLKREGRIACYAVASFCCSQKTFRRLFTKDEFIKAFGELWYPGQPVRYYLEPGETKRPKLAFLKVDDGGQGQWDRLIDSCMRFLRQRTDVNRVASHYRLQTEAFSQLVNRGRFQISVLTSLPEKQRAIELELERRRATEQPCPPIRSYVVPGLFDVMFPAPSMAAV